MGLGADVREFTKCVNVITSLCAAFSLHCSSSTKCVCLTKMMGCAKKKGKDRVDVDGEGGLGNRNGGK